MLSTIKEKSWSVLLEEGFMLNGQVRGQRCFNCKSAAEILALNQSNPNLLLYGCKDTKCKHRFLRLDMEKEGLPNNPQQLS
ncbi:MAG: hypothetical protein NWE93_03880 [Candidatus Bathyarchaeota archaeon]|nr:hypothetical protein [Candidatus Bathyarchaeota archaeon]